MREQTHYERTIHMMSENLRMDEELAESKTQKAIVRLRYAITCLEHGCFNLISGIICLRNELDEQKAKLTNKERNELSEMLRRAGKNAAEHAEILRIETDEALALLIALSEVTRPHRPRGRTE